MPNQRQQLLAATQQRAAAEEKTTIQWLFMLMKLPLTYKAKQFFMFKARHANDDEKLFVQNKEENFSKKYRKKILKLG